MKKFISFINKNRSSVIIVIIGLLIRLMFIPITLYVDLLSATFRQYLFVQDGIFRLSNLQELILSGYLHLFNDHLFLIPQTISNFRPQGDHQIFTNALGAVDIFAKSNLSMRTLFVLKFPYLIFELAATFVLLKIYDDRLKNIWLILLWWLNPILIYAVYAWGRYDIIPLLLVLVSIYFAKKDKVWYSFIFLGFAIACRDVYLIILPLYLIYFYKNKHSLISQILVVYLPIYAIDKLFAFLKNFEPNISSSLYILSASYSNSIDYVLYTTISTNDSKIAPLFFIIPLIYLYFLSKKKKNFDLLVKFSTAVFVVFLVLSRIHPHYMIWLMPFLILAIADNKKFLYSYLVFVVAFFCYFALAFSIRTNITMFLPVNYDLFINVGSLWEKMLISYRSENLILISRTLYVFTAGVMLWFLIFQRNKK